LIDIVMRCRNDAQMLPSTLAGLKRQTVPYRLFAMDNASDDGSRELLLEAAYEVVDIPTGRYIPGKVLNEAIRHTTSPIVVFLNSDCEPVNEFWLQRLIDAMDDPKVGAAFGRQMPRPGCFSWFERDTEATFGDGKEQAKWRHCFSMASSVLRRSAWELEPFDEDLVYSEDVELTLRLKNRGFEIRYAPEAQVLHSHNYTWRQYYKRQYGEGKAEAAIMKWSPFQKSWFRYSLFPYIRQVGRDIKYCGSKRRFGDGLKSIFVRTAQLLGRRKGFLDGLREVSGR